MTTKQAAAFVGRGIDCLMARRLRELPPASVKIGAHVFYERGELVKFIQGKGASAPRVPGLLSTKEAAAFVRRGAECLKARRLSGLPPHAVRIGHRVFYERGELVKFIQGEPLTPAEEKRAEKVRAAARRYCRSHREAIREGQRRYYAARKASAASNADDEARA